VHAELDATLAALAPRLGAPAGVPHALDGGITNRNFRLQLGGRDVVVRLPGKDTGLLGIDRSTEREATEAAARAGVGPEVVGFLVEPPCLVTAFIPGRPVEAEELRVPPLVDDVAAALRVVHEGPALRSRFDSFAIVERYRATAAGRGVPIPPIYAKLADGAHAIRQALAGPEHAPVPCHNDLLTANFLHDGGRVRIVDWEYAGMGDRYFDLGNLSVNNGFAEADDERLLSTYWREPCTPRRFAALRLMRIMSDFREGMWGVVQTAISQLDFDFPSYAQEHLERVAAGLADARFPTWLEDARGDRA
jgi:aminoglycoside phosphotransferase (APT) family kinase protein